MKKHTSFKIGGPADFFVKLKDVEELKSVKKLVLDNDIPFIIVGNGSNLLVKDNGIRGIVAKLDFDNLKIDEKNGIVIASGDYAISKMARKCAKLGLSKIEFLAGIPGTIGGAIRMNAGAYGSEIKDILESITFLNDNLELITISNKEANFGYRYSMFCDNPNFIIVEAKLKLEKDLSENINSRIDELMKSRIEKQPINYPSAGSTFKRLPNQVTAVLIDECGLKGTCVGDAEVSTKHAGFIINKGNATAKDVLNLIEIVKNKVYERFEERIELEVIVLGE